MRGCASIITTITELRPANAPTVTRIFTADMTASQGVPAARSAAAWVATTTGAGSFSIAPYGTSPTITPETST